VSAAVERRLIDELLGRVLAEDLGVAGDVTSTSIFGADDCAVARIQSKAKGVLSGAYLVEPLFARLDSRLCVQLRAQDGDALDVGSPIADVHGPIRAILAGERTALNLLRHLSGVATLTARMVATMGPGRVRLLDTRKTTPGLRAFEKLAVVHGGGVNHRFGLFDMVLIKGTHVKAAGGLAQAIRRARASQSVPAGMKIEVEVQSPAQCEEALAERPDIIMLDNMDVPAMRECVERVRRASASVELEASGNITLETIGAVAQTGVDYISVGALTHSAPALDIHLVIIGRPGPTAVP
jgi:nicotinate-nucleotide pyrophosphorylase (carboxylating)